MMALSSVSVIPATPEVGSIFPGKITKRCRREPGKNLEDSLKKSLMSDSGVCPTAIAVSH